jgi:hypothetical protein
MDETIRKNERCFIGLPSCGYGYESAKLCFVACPSDEKYTLKVDAIKDIVESKQYECHIALKRIDPGNFAFCTKICSKIIQSQFCIVLLDPSTNKAGQEGPNPNVHLEYGMMMSQNKHIIPLQDEKHNLAFNISPLDTIKYSEANFKLKVTEAVDNTIKRFSERKVSGPVPQGPEIFTFYNLSAYTLSDIQVQIFKLLYNLGSYLGFYLFDNKDKYKYVGLFDYENPKTIILNTKLLIDNIISTYERLASSKADDVKEGTYDYLINDVSIDITVPTFFEKKDILDRIEKIINKNYKFCVSVYYRTDITNRIEDEYKKIGDIKIRRPIS